MGWEYWNYTPAAPRKVRNGIKARSRKGRIGSTWWSERWLKILESYGSGWNSNRLERGKRYARMGQVIDFKIDRGAISARVQGSRPKPYNVTIAVKVLDDDRWSKAIEAMSGQAVYAAKLLGGEMPEDIEQAFADGRGGRGVPTGLFPSRAEFKADCTCPDPANPCKHIAAVCYIIAEEFDRDPFMIFKLRGRSREDILASLRDARNRDATPVGGIEPASGQSPGKHSGDRPTSHGPAVHHATLKQKGTGATTLESLVRSFWHRGTDLQMDIHIEPPRVNAALIKRLGEPPFWRHPKDFVEIMDGIYDRVSKRARSYAVQ